MSNHIADFNNKSKKVSYEWKINFFKRQDKCYSLKSPKFLLHDSYHYIKADVHCKTGDNAGGVYLTLHRNIYPSNSNISLRNYMVKMGLKRVDGSYLRCHNTGRLHLGAEDDTSESIRFRCVFVCDGVSRSEGTLIAYCRIIVLTDPDVKAEIQSSMPDSVVKLLQSFEQLYLSGCQTDVVMNVRGEKFSAHRLILSIRSSVFRSLFELNMEEKETGAINITDCDPESFGSFLLFLYNGKLDVVSPSNALGLYTTAHKYDVQDLKKACCKCLRRNLCANSICDVLCLASLHGEEKLLTWAKSFFLKFLLKDASKIFGTSSWQNLMERNTSLAEFLITKYKHEQIVSNLINSIRL